MKQTGRIIPAGFLYEIPPVLQLQNRGDDVSE